MLGKCNREPGKTMIELENPVKIATRPEMQKEKLVVEKLVNHVSQKKRMVK